jgi:hypothetical protein
MTIKASVHTKATRTKRRQLQKQPVPLGVDLDDDVYETSLTIPMSYRLRSQLENIAKDSNKELDSMVRVALLTLVESQRARGS